MGWLDGLMGYVNPVVGLVGGVSGLLSGSSARRRAEEEMRNALSSYARSLDAQNNNAMGDELRGLYGGEGLGMDGVVSSGRSLGDALGRAGVYDSSALAGALSNQAIGNASAVSGAYANMDAARRRAYQQGQGQLAQMRLGFGGDMLHNANNALGGTAGGLQSWLQGMGQMNNQQTGVSAQMNGLGVGNGNAGKGGFGTMNSYASPFAPSPSEKMMGYNPLKGSGYSLYGG